MGVMPSWRTALCIALLVAAARWHLRSSETLPIPLQPSSSATETVKDAAVTQPEKDAAVPPTAPKAAEATTPAEDAAQVLYNTDQRRLYNDHLKTLATAAAASKTSSESEVLTVDQLVAALGPSSVFSPAELAQYDGSPKAPGLYLAIIGEVFDVSAGTNFYAPGGGYAFFAGKDGSAAFISGDFSPKGLHDKLDHLGSSEVSQLFEWVAGTFEKKYRRVGVLQGTFFDKAGAPTAARLELLRKQEQSVIDKARLAELKVLFPTCDSNWSKAAGGKVICPDDPKTGARRVPRKFTADKNRCACVHQDRLVDEQLIEYENCDKTASTCPTGR